MLGYCIATDCFKSITKWKAPPPPFPEFSGLNQGYHHEGEGGMEDLSEQGCSWYNFWSEPESEAKDMFVFWSSSLFSFLECMEPRAPYVPGARALVLPGF